MSATTGITADEVRDLTLTNQQISAIAAILESKIAFNTASGHNHNGINSRFVPGGSGGGNGVIDASFTGSINGINATFTLPSNFISATVAVYVDGLRYKRGTHFNEVSVNQVTFTTAPPTGAIIVIDYISA